MNADQNTTTACQVALVLLLLSSPAIADEAPSWHLLTRSYGGSVTLLKNLTKHECEFARDRMRGLPATPAEKKAAEAAANQAAAGWHTWETNHHCDPNGLSGGTTGASYKDLNGTCMRGNEFNPGGGWYSISSGDIVSAECFE